MGINENPPSTTKIQKLSSLSDIQSAFQRDGSYPKNPIATTISVIVLILVLAGGIFINWSYLEILVSPLFRSANTPDSSESSSFPKEPEITPIGIGEHMLIVTPGSEYILADGQTRILFGNSGSSESVPDVVFGNNYNLNDIHTINYLPIRGNMSFYNQGVFISLTNRGCKKETRLTDVEEVWVKECSIHTTSRKEDAPLKTFPPFSIETYAGGGYHTAFPDIANGLLIDISSTYPFLEHRSTKSSTDRVSLSVNSQTSYSTEQTWNIQVISGYGIDTLQYTAQEIWDRKSKELLIGPLSITASIKDMDCEAISIESEENQIQRCRNILMGISFRHIEEKQLPITLVSYDPRNALDQ